MTRRFRLEVDLVVPEDSEAKAIEMAQHYVGQRAVMACEGACRSDDEPISCIDDALVELAVNHQLLLAAGVRLGRSAIRVSQIGAIERVPMGGSADEWTGLGEFEPGVYLCRWPNGDFSLVQADTPVDAIVSLDEFGGADPDWLLPMQSCMIDFRLNDDGDIELQQFGEETDSFIWEHCYPALQQVLAKESNPDSDTPPDVTATVIKEAVNHERTRLWDDPDDRSQASETGTPLGSRLTERPRTVRAAAGARLGGPVKTTVEGRGTSRSRCSRSWSGRRKPRG